VPVISNGKHFAPVEDHTCPDSRHSPNINDLAISRLERKLLESAQEIAMSEDFPRSESEYPQDHQHPQTGSGSQPAPPARGSWLGLLAILLVVAAAFAYGFREHRAAARMSAQNSEMKSSLNATRSQLDAMTTKLNELTAAQAEKPTAVANPHPVSRKPATARHLRAEDPRWRAIRAQLSEQGKLIDSTRQDLSNTRTELQGSIARTHDELVLLEKKGERAYFEFDLDKNGQFQRQGPVGIRLKKANTKHQYADLELMVDDYRLSKKHVNIYEPVVFYAAENGRPVELVVNSISKNHIHGYVSQPRYRESELQAMGGTPAAETQNAGTPPAAPERKKLEMPK
jgi:uncharacterized coiled-coil protein SlyX